jgi:KipI family sensor histidine kinase inhibitor
MNDVRFCAASDRSLLIYLGDTIGQATHRRVVRLLHLLQAEPLKWIRNIQPAYCSLLVSFDACTIDHATAESTLRKYLVRAEIEPAVEPRTVKIPVCYGGDLGPDLAEVAAMHGLSVQRVVEIHSTTTYYAYFLGFVPGFAYLGNLPEAIAAPRLATPRKTVPAGSVGIAGRQTGVYPFATPGGWRLIGRTPLQMFPSENLWPCSLWEMPCSFIPLRVKNLAGRNTRENAGGKTAWIADNRAGPWARGIWCARNFFLGPRGCRVATTGKFATGE